MLALSANAQDQKGSTSKQTASRQPVAGPGNVVTPEIERLMEEYRFEEAIDLLQKEINTARKKKLPTLSLENELHKANMGDTMLEATEKVSFIDSLTISKDSFLEALRLSRSAGRIGRLGDFLRENGPLSPASGGQTYFLNEFADRAYFSLPDSTGCLRLHASFRLGTSWTAPESLKGLSGESVDGYADYPFLLADGVTMYYAAQGEGSLGGYDIFVTRYNSDSQSFVKPENIGMPFNSPYNDYLYMIDEEAGIGWFVSDRYQPADKVCVYSFIPNESRNSYELTENSAEHVRQAARLRPFASSRGTERQMDEARRRLQAVLDQTASSEAPHPRFIISNTLSYTDLSQFRNSSARLIASQWLKSTQRLQQLQDKLQEKRKEYAGGNHDGGLKGSIISLEKEVEELRLSVATLAKNMRAAELAGQ